MIDRLWLNKRLSESKSKTLSASELADYDKARNLIQLMVWHDADKKNGWDKVETAILQYKPNEIIAALIIIGEHMRKNASGENESLTWQEAVNIISPSFKK